MTNQKMYDSICPLRLVMAVTRCSGSNVRVPDQSERGSRLKEMKEEMTGLREQLAHASQRPHSSSKHVRWHSPGSARCGWRHR